MNQHSQQRDFLGEELHRLVAELYPLHRSITGRGVRQTLRVLQRLVPLQMHEIPTGTQVFDWQVPQEWSIRDAYIKDERGKRIVNYLDSNLHVVNYSEPVRATMPWRELRQHIHTLPEHPDWIPYRTSYFKRTWGFCMSYRQYERLEQAPERQYDVCIDAEHFDGSLTYGEVFLPGKSRREVLISCHTCHPSLANDNLSGIAVAAYLARHLQTMPRRYTYRFLFLPATIGAITWLAVNKPRAANVKGGLILSLLGDAGHPTYKKSRRGDAEIDRAAAHVLNQSKLSSKIVDFEPFGYDERQFCSPGFDLPMGCLMRTPNGCFPEYHSSADNLDFVKPQALAESLSRCQEIVEVLEGNRTYENQKPYCEPQLGRHGLYKAFGEQGHGEDLQRAVMWVLNLSDGHHDLLTIAERADLPFAVVSRAAELLRQCGLLKETAADQSMSIPASASISLVNSTPSTFSIG